MIDRNDVKYDANCWKLFSESGDNKIFYRGCMNPYPGYGIGECYEADYGYSKTKICFCGEDKCNGIDM